MLHLEGKIPGRSYILTNYVLANHNKINLRQIRDFTLGKWMRWPWKKLYPEIIHQNSKMKKILHTGWRWRYYKSSLEPASRVISSDLSLWSSHVWVLLCCSKAILCDCRPLLETKLELDKHVCFLSQSPRAKNITVKLHLCFEFTVQQKCALNIFLSRSVRWLCDKGACCQV